ncbi:MAG TPA: hypothetical protein VD837_03750 [Terriglobales bacterium]|nr:hypothetical protein [Terriglobales bacterium]
MTRNVSHEAIFVAPISSLRLALAYPRVSLMLCPSVARANLFAGD